MTELVQEQDRTGYSPMHVAARYGRCNVVAFFLNLSGVDVNDKDLVGRTPLSIACLFGHLDVAELLASRPDVDFNLADNMGNVALLQAVQRKNFESVVDRLLSRRDTDLNRANEMTGSTPGHYAIHAHNYAIVRKFAADSRFDVNAADKSSYTPLMALLLTVQENERVR